MSTAYGFSGRILATSEVSCIVDLDDEIDGQFRAYASSNTIGFDSLLKQGRVRVGELVIGTAEKHGSHLVAATIKRMGEAGRIMPS